MVRYHDDEWGVPVTDDMELFERLILECFQAGLSWTTTSASATASVGRSPASTRPRSRHSTTRMTRLLADAGIVRNRAKVDATIGNAAAFLAVVGEHGSFAEYLGTVVGRAPGLPAPPLPAGTTFADLVPTTPASDTLSADLKRRGFEFVGPTIAYAFMESVGLVDDHLPGCWRYRG